MTKYKNTLTARQVLLGVAIVLGTFLVVWLGGFLANSLSSPTPTAAPATTVAVVGTAAPNTGASINTGNPQLDFLANKAQEAGVISTGSGLMYRVVREGSGPRPASAADTVTVHYRGTLIDGTEFDSSYARNQPSSFALSDVIAGWTEGVQLMTVGSVYEFYIPADLAYGAGGRPGIPGGATLIFTVELISIP
jgi:FKBP-type peptidyl-prolyl cis-trans isomerase